MAGRLFVGILVFGLVACERSSEASEATPVTSHVVTRQDAKAAVAPKAPAATAKRTLSANKQFSMVMLQAISSRTAKAGNSYSAMVVADVRDDAGRVVLPATSLVSGTIAEVTSASSRYNTGTLTLTVNGVTIRGKNYPLTARIDSLATRRARRQIRGQDAVDVSMGVAVGAIIGQIITKNTQGTVIGAAVGAVTGGIYGAATKNRDIRLPEGAHVIVTLSLPLTISGRRS